MVVSLRARSMVWLATGMALALFLVWSFGSWRASASFGPDESTLVPVTPTRILDTRDPVNLGLDGPFVSAVSQELQVTGEIPTADGPRTVVPAGATGVVVNVTVVQPTAAGFVSVRPAGTPGAPTTSSLNFEAGVIVPNSVSVQVPNSGADAGRIELTYDAFGAAGPTTDLLIDVVAYTTNAGLADIAARVSALETDVAAAEATIASLQTDLAGKQDVCADGAVLAAGWVPALPGAEFTDVAGFSCTGSPLQARRASAGQYRIRIDGRDLNSADAIVHLTTNGTASNGVLVGYQFNAATSTDMIVRVRLETGGVSGPLDQPFYVTIYKAPQVPPAAGS